MRVDEPGMHGARIMVSATRWDCGSGLQQRLRVSFRSNVAVLGVADVKLLASGDKLREMYCYWGVAALGIYVCALHAPKWPWSREMPPRSVCVAPCTAFGQRPRKFSAVIRSKSLTSHDHPVILIYTRVIHGWFLCDNYVILGYFSRISTGKKLES